MGIDSLGCEARDGHENVVGNSAKAASYKHAIGQLWLKCCSECSVLGGPELERWSRDSAGDRDVTGSCRSRKTRLRERDSAITTNAYDRIGMFAGIRKRDRPITADESTLERNAWNYLEELPCD